MPRPQYSFRKQEDLYNSLERTLTVDLIATYNLETCGADDSLATVLLDARFESFDNIPVESGGFVVGLIQLRKLEKSPDYGTRKSDPTVRARDVMQRLDQSILISAGSGILGYMDSIETAEPHDARLILQGTRVAGIVTRSDLQKLVVRTVVGVVIMHVELLMEECIRKGYSEDEWIKRLTPGRREKLVKRQEMLKKRHLETDLLAAAEFIDKANAVAALRNWGKPKRVAADELGEVESFRNFLFHGRDYTATIELQNSMIRSSKLARDWIARIDKHLADA